MDLRQGAVVLARDACCMTRRRINSCSPLFSLVQLLEVFPEAGNETVDKAVQ